MLFAFTAHTIKRMGLTVEESDLRLFMLCADESQLDMDRVQRIKTVKTSKGKATPKEKVKEDGGDDKPKKKAAKKDESDSGFTSEVDFETAVATKGKSKKKKKKHSHGNEDTSGDDEDLDERVCVMEKQQKVGEINSLSKTMGLDVRATTKESIVDIRRKHDWVMRQKSVETGVNTIMFFIPISCPIIESFVLKNFPAIDIKGWAESIIAVKDYLRSPIEEVWRRNMLQFGMSIDPTILIGAILLGSMGIAFFCNKFGYNPKSCITSATGIFCGFAGVTKREPQPNPVQASPPRPNMAPPPIPKLSHQPQPQPSPAQQPSTPQPPVTKRHIQKPVF